MRYGFNKIRRAHRIFEHIVFEDISCENLTFHKCTFRNTQFMEHQVRRLELNGCTLSESTFSGKRQNTVFILHENYFRECNIHDLEVSEASEPSEMIGCMFGDCTFMRIKIYTKAAVSDGWFADCTGDGIEIANIDVGKESGHRTSTFQNCSINGELHESF